MSTTRQATRMKSHEKNQPLQPRIGDGVPKHVPLSGQTPAVVVRDDATLLQLNVEGQTKAKINVLIGLAQAYAVTAILLQETHYKDRSHFKIPGYTLAACTERKVHSTATFVKHHAKWSAIAVSPENLLLEWTPTEVEGITIINVYKPPSVKMDTTGLPYFSRPCMYAGDSNSHSTTWDYRLTNASGEALEDGAFASGLNLLHDPKQPDSFHSRRWNTGTNPDLASVNLAGPLPHRTIIPTWDSECDQRYSAFLLAESRVDSDFKAEELTSCLDRKRRKRWIESVEGIDLIHSSRKAWKTFSRLTGRCARPSQCPDIANAIAHQLLANGRYAGASKAHSLNVKR